jgi:formylglycine-generating enzyme required for sulfatase activity
MGAVVLIVLAFAAIGERGGANAQEQTDWLKQRHTEFDQWRAANPDLAKAVATLKAKTAELVAQHAADRKAHADADHTALVARSSALSPEQRAKVTDLGQQAKDLSKAGNCGAAVPLYKTIVEMDPANDDANVGLANCLRQQGDLTGAAASYAAAASFPDFSAPGNSYFAAMLALQNLPAPPDERLAEPPAIFRVPGAPAELWDAPFAPRMVIIPGGEFTMGSPVTEHNHQNSETQHRVQIGYPLAVGKYDITRGEFAAFVAATGYDAKGKEGCYIGGEFGRDPNADWRSPGFAQSDNDPVVCINYYDAVAYAAWLSKATGQTYRLPSEAEWEYALRAGSTSEYYWGDEVGLGHANCDGCTAGPRAGKPTPGGTFPPNGFGLYDMSGNVWKWLADCWNDTYVGAPADGSSWEAGTCVLRGRRGGSWFNLAAPKAGDVRAPFRLRSAARFGSLPDIRFSSFGFRVVRSL